MKVIRADNYDWFRVVPDEYVLYVFETMLIRFTHQAI